MKTISALYTVNAAAWLKGLTLAVMGAIASGIMVCLNSIPPHIPTTLVEMQPILIGGISAGVAYVLHKFATNSNGEFLKAEPKTDAPTK